MEAHSPIKPYVKLFLKAYDPFYQPLLGHDYRCLPSTDFIHVCHSRIWAALSQNWLQEKQKEIGPEINSLELGECYSWQGDSLSPVFHVIICLFILSIFIVCLLWPCIVVGASDTVKYKKDNISHFLELTFH